MWRQIVHWITSSAHENSKFRTSWEHIVYINCSECQKKNKKKIVNTTRSELGIFMYWTGNSMNNLSSCCGLVDARMSASDKYLSVLLKENSEFIVGPNKQFTYLLMK